MTATAERTGLGITARGDILTGRRSPAALASQQLGALVHRR